MEAPKPGKIITARNLRREQTPFERKLWEILRAGRLNGFHFRRQYPIGPYIADFACITAKLVVELDGNSHDTRLERDANRDAHMNAMGWRVLRFPNAYLRDSPDDLRRTIELELEELQSSEEPPP